MPNAILELNDLEIEPTSVSYLDKQYRHSGYPIQYSPSLTRTGKNYYDSKEELPEGFRMSTVATELAIQLSRERVGIDPRKAEVFNDLFARNEERWYAHQLTGTGLRVPKGWENGRQDKIDGRIAYPRIVLIGDQEVGEILVPEGNGRIIVEWNEVFGIPLVTFDQEEDMDYKNHITHFSFNPNPLKIDKRTGRQDVALARRNYWPCSGRELYLSVSACSGRWAAGPYHSFRLVRGSLPEIYSGTGLKPAASKQEQVEEPDDIEKRTKGVLEDLD